MNVSSEFLRKVTSNDFAQSTIVLKKPYSEANIMKFINIDMKIVKTHTLVNPADLCTQARKKKPGTLFLRLRKCNFLQLHFFRGFI